MVAAPPPPPPATGSWDNYPKTPKKRPGWLIPVIVAVVVLVLLFCGGIIALIAHNSNDDKSPVVVPPVVTTAPAQPTVDPTTESPPTPAPTALTPSSVTSIPTPDFIQTSNRAAFIQAVRGNGDLSVISILNDDDTMQLGVATCIILAGDSGSTSKTTSDLQTAAKGKLSSAGADALLKTAHTNLCPSLPLN